MLKLDAPGVLVASCYQVGGQVANVGWLNRATIDTVIVTEVTM
jgi:hypothetical protein